MGLLDILKSACCTSNTERVSEHHDEPAAPAEGAASQEHEVAAPAPASPKAAASPRGLSRAASNAGALKRGPSGMEPPLKRTGSEANVKAGVAAPVVMIPGIIEVEEEAGKESEEASPTNLIATPAETDAERRARLQTLVLARALRNGAVAKKSSVAAIQQEKQSRQGRRERSSSRQGRQGARMTKSPKRTSSTASLRRGSYARE